MKNNKLYSWELELFEKINSLLSKEESDIFKYQVEMYNHIYRDQEGREILFYCKKMFRILKIKSFKKIFPIKEESKILSKFSIILHNGEVITGNLHIVEGRVFSLNFSKIFNFDNVSNYIIKIEQVGINECNCK